MQKGARRERKQRRQQGEGTQGKTNKGDETKPKIAKTKEETDENFSELKKKGQKKRGANQLSITPRERIRKCPKRTALRSKLLVTDGSAEIGERRVNCVASTEYKTRRVVVSVRPLRCSTV